MTASRFTYRPIRAGDRMTVEQLAEVSQIRIRTIRSYQTYGLMPGPEKIRRTSYYSDAHLVRLFAITRLQARGFSLASIGALFQAWDRGQSLAEVLGFDDAATAPGDDDGVGGDVLAGVARFRSGGANLTQTGSDTS